MSDHVDKEIISRWALLLYVSSGESVRGTERRLCGWPYNSNTRGGGWSLNQTLTSSASTNAAFIHSPLHFYPQLDDDDQAV